MPGAVGRRPRARRRQPDLRPGRVGDEVDRQRQIRDEGRDDELVPLRQALVSHETTEDDAVEDEPGERPRVPTSGHDEREHASAYTGGAAASGYTTQGLIVAPTLAPAGAARDHQSPAPVRPPERPDGRPRSSRRRPESALRAEPGPATAASADRIGPPCVTARTTSSGCRSAIASNPDTTLAPSSSYVSPSSQPAPVVEPAAAVGPRLDLVA